MYLAMVPGAVSFFSLMAMGYIMLNQILETKKNEKNQSRLT